MPVKNLAKQKHRNRPERSVYTAIQRKAKEWAEQYGVNNYVLAQLLNPKQDVFGNLSMKIFKQSSRPEELC